MGSEAAGHHLTTLAQVTLQVHAATLRQAHPTVAEVAAHIAAVPTAAEAAAHTAAVEAVRVVASAAVVADAPAAAAEEEAASAVEDHTMSHHTISMYFRIYIS